MEPSFFVFTGVILHAESLIVQRGKNARLNLNEDIIFETLIHPERKLIPKCTATEIVNAKGFSENCVAVLHVRLD